MLRIQVWYIAEDEERFMAALNRKYPDPATRLRVLAKRLRPDFDPKELKDAGVRILFQPPGYTVVILAGTVYHWTVSLGFRYGLLTKTYYDQNLDIVGVDVF